MTHEIKNLITLFLEKNESWHYFLIKNWKEIIGNLHSKVQLMHITHNTLVLGVHDSSWMHELSLMSTLLIKQINQKLDHPHVKQLHFKKLARAKITTNKRKIKTRVKANMQPIMLNAKEEKILETIQDHELQLVLRNFLVRCYQERDYTDDKDNYNNHAQSFSSPTRN